MAAAVTTEPAVFITGWSRLGLGDTTAGAFATRGRGVLAEVAGTKVMTLEVLSGDSITALVAKLRLAGDKLPQIS